MSNKFLPMENKQFKRIPRGEINDYISKTRRNFGISPNDRGKVITTQVTHGYRVDLTGNEREMADQLDETDRQYCKDSAGNDKLIPLSLGFLALGIGLSKLSDIAYEHKMNIVSNVLNGVGMLSTGFGMLAGTIKGIKILEKEIQK